MDTDTKTPVADPGADSPEPPVDDLTMDDLLEDELLVEEISIDGMCGVY